MQDRRIGKLILLMGRIISAMTLLVFIFVAITDPPVLSRFSTVDLLNFIPFIVMIAGLILGMFKPGFGASFLMVGFVVFVLMNIISTGSYWVHWFFFVFPLIGIIYLMAWNKSKPLNKNDNS